MHVQSGDKGEAAEKRLADYLKNEIETKYRYVPYDGEESRGRGSKSSSGESRSSSSSASRQSSPDVRLKSVVSKFGRKPRPNPKTTHSKSNQKQRDGPRIKITPGKRQDVAPKPCKPTPMPREDSPAPLGDGPDVEVLDPVFQPPSRIPRDAQNLVESLEDFIVRATPAVSDICDSETLRSTEILKQILNSMTKLHSTEPQGHMVEHYTTREDPKGHDVRKVIIKEVSQVEIDDATEARQEGSKASAQKKVQESESEEGRQAEEQEAEEEGSQVNKEIVEEGRQVEEKRLTEEYEAEEEGSQVNKEIVEEGRQVEEKRLTEEYEAEEEGSQVNKEIVKEGRQVEEKRQAEEYETEEE